MTIERYSSLRVLHLLLLIVLLSVALLACSTPPVVDNRMKGAQLQNMSLRQIFPDRQVRQLADAGARGDVVKIMALVDAGLDVNSVGVNDGTALYWALRTKNLIGFSTLLKIGANPNIQIGCNGSNVGVINKFQRCASTTVMHFAIFEGLSEFVSVALSYDGNSSTRDAGTYPLLYHALIRDDYVVAEMLLEHRADLNAVITGRIDQPLLFSMMSAGKYRASTWLINSGAKLNIFDELGNDIQQMIKVNRKTNSVVNVKLEGFDELVQLIAQKTTRIIN